MFAFTLLHVALSLVGIASGFVVLYGLLTARRLPAWTAVFLATTVATSVTAFGFPFTRLLPSHILAAISLVVLAVAVYALYVRRLAGGWRTAYVVSATTAQYLNVFVLIVQSFLKVPALKALAPTQTEPPFAVTQLATLAAFLAVGYLATRGFRLAALPAVAARSASVR